MKSTGNASPSSLANTTSQLTGRASTTAGAGLSLPRLHFLRLGYFVMAVGLAVTKWPLLMNHDGPWPLMEGVETSMLVALSLLSLLGLRYPVKMLPILLTVIAVPLLTAGQMDPATMSVFYACLWVVIVLAVLPWRYVVTQYVTKKGDPWRSDATRPVSDQL